MKEDLQKQPLLYYSKLYASFHSYQFIQTWVQSGKNKFGSKCVSFCLVWPWYLADDLEENIRAPLQYHCNICASLWSHVLIWTGVRAQKHQIWAKLVLTFVTLNFDFWPLNNDNAALFAPNWFLRQCCPLGLSVPKFLVLLIGILWHLHCFMQKNVCRS